MERICPSCGADPGAGDFCQHCGTRLVEDESSPPSPAPAAVAPQPTPPTIPTQAPKRSGCLTGVAVFIALVVLLLGVGGFFAWRFFDERVLPEIEETASQFDSLTEAPPGPCYDLVTENDSLAGWTEVSCSGPRQAEVSFAASFEEGPFPGTDYLVDTAGVTCVDAFEKYVGVAPEQSAYEVRWLLPTESHWDAGNRQGVCLVVADDGSQLTGTVKGSGT